jgi:hypothetical protein
MKKLYSYFLVSRHDRTELLKEEFEIKDIDGEEFVYFSKNKIQLFSQIPLNEFIYCEYQGVNGYQMLSLADYPTAEIKPLFLTHILPQREKLLKELAQKLANAAESTQSLISNPIKVL